ncbi:MAG TPA: HNH endonuclease signature motif containing protein [Solirubrobacterales bacterium]|nr:HNH endonuclease signature motif containing protein [Solirubrobacterales bacterium]
MRCFPENRSWRALSAAVTAGAECAHCGSREDLVAHHRLPRRYGGLDVPSNLEPVCRSCHPRVEQESIAHAKLVWERPERPETARPPRRRPRVIPPY